MSSEPSAVTATLYYFNPPKDGSKPYQYNNSDPKTGLKEKNWTKDPHESQIQNLRGKESCVSLDTAGFQFFKHPTRHKEFTDDAKIKEEYYPESIELLKKLTGASRVVLFDHTIRRNNPDLRGDTRDTRKPVPQVHVDTTSQFATKRVHRHLPAEDVPKLLQGRFQIVNLWRPIGHPAHNFPLAFCDYRSVNTETDLVPTTLRYPDKNGETNNVKFNPGHKWNYVRGLTPDEGVLIKCFDSIQDGSVAVLTPHTAFVDPTAPADAPKRQSIELRALVFYD